MKHFNQIQFLMNTTTINYWKGEYPEIQEELHRVVKMAYHSGVATANWILPSYLDQTAIASTEETFRLSLEGHLKTQMELRLSLNNPFRLLSGDLSLEQLAEKFSRAYLSTSSPEEVLQWLKGVDMYEVRVTDLAVGVSHYLLRKELVRILSIGYDGWIIENENISTETEVTNLSDEDQSNAENKELDAFSPAERVAPEGSSPEDSNGIKRQKKKSPRAEAMEKLHGFPWINEPTKLAIISIHNYLLENKMIEPSLSESDLRALFSEKGPLEPIRFLKASGKLVMLFRLLAMDVLKFSNKGPILDEFSKSEIRSSSYWLFPRLIGTFRNKKGEKYNTDQLSKSASQWQVDKLQKMDWFIQMKETLTAACKPR
ncbi:hypothetical protein [Adhaeribacter soli]|uniref:Uncharacterized protein n=1 Tax=Adhaeribacter soli TaxID=2607655 RepID=A0A5N1J2N7_9BACT|nr:hypothetical protein [Adhaeribacter soli]KAA9338803.1 hypothetical protein F0P94_08380 [Adhaeribacter soli]